MLTSVPLPLICTLILLLSAPILMSACTQSASSDPTIYAQASVTPLDAELVRVEVAATGGNTQTAVPRYADCVAAQYTLIRGLSYLRRISMDQKRRSDTRLANVVYTLSGEKPRGSAVIVAERAVDACKTANVPTF